MTTEHLKALLSQVESSVDAEQSLTRTRPSGFEERAEFTFGEYGWCVRVSVRNRQARGRGSRRPKPRRIVPLPHPTTEPTMTNLEIEEHNTLCAELTAGDGIPRLSWEQHGAAFDSLVVEHFAAGQLVAAWDSSTPGTVGELRDGMYDVTFPDLVGGPCRYTSSQLRPWPPQVGASGTEMGDPNAQ